MGNWIQYFVEDGWSLSYVYSRWEPGSALILIPPDENGHPKFNGAESIVYI